TGENGFAFHPARIEFYFLIVEPISVEGDGEEDPFIVGVEYGVARDGAVVGVKSEAEITGGNGAGIDAIHNLRSDNLKTDAADAGGENAVEVLWIVLQVDPKRDGGLVQVIEFSIEGRNGFVSFIGENVAALGDIESADGGVSGSVIGARGA